MRTSMQPGSYKHLVSCSYSVHEISSEHLSRENFQHAPLTSYRKYGVRSSVSMLRYD